MIDEENDFESSFDEPIEGDNLGEDGLGKASPREDLFGIIDLVFKGATEKEAVHLADQFICLDIFEGSMPTHRNPDNFGRPEGEVMVRVIYRRVIHSPKLEYNDSPRRQRESVVAAYKAMRLKLPDGRAWKMANHHHIIWFPWNKLTYETTILLDQMADSAQQG